MRVLRLTGDPACRMHSVAMEWPAFNAMYWPDTVRGSWFRSKQNPVPIIIHENEAGPEAASRPESYEYDVLRITPKMGFS